MIHTWKKYNCDCPSWTELLENFNYSMMSNEEIIHIPPTFFVSHEANKIKKVQKVLKDLELNQAHLYFNLTCINKSFGRHKDADDVFFWQVQGKTKWNFDNFDPEILEPGDLIKVPKGIYHSVVPLTPRAGISMSL